jgi:hypothetical protein
MTNGPHLLPTFLVKSRVALLIDGWTNLLSLDVRPPSCVLNAFTDAAVANCDALDGVEDGIISLPGQYNFNAASIVGQTVNCSEPEGIVVITD